MLGRARTGQAEPARTTVSRHKGRHVQVSGVAQRGRAQGEGEWKQPEMRLERKARDSIVNGLLHQAIHTSF